MIAIKGVLEEQTVKNGFISNKLRVSAADLARCGVEATEAKRVTVKVNFTEYPLWQSSKNPFKFFGETELEVVAVEPRHLDADLSIGRKEPMDWLEAVGARPAGTEAVAAPSLEELIAAAEKAKAIGSAKATQQGTPGF